MSKPKILNMKKLIFFSLLAIILASCDGCDDPINPPVIVEKFTITGMINGSGGTINPFSQTVEKGKSATFTINPTYGYEIDYLLDDGYKLPATDVYTVKDINKDDTFEVFFKKDSIVWPLINIVWNVDSIYVEHEDGSIFHYKESDWTQDYSSNGSVTETKDGKSYTSKYYLDRVKLTITTNDGFNKTVFKIEVLNENKMILSSFKGVEKWYIIYSKFRYK